MNFDLFKLPRGWLNPLLVSRSQTNQSRRRESLISHCREHSLVVLRTSHVGMRVFLSRRRALSTRENSHVDVSMDSYGGAILSMRQGSFLALNFDLRTINSTINRAMRKKRVRSSRRREIFCRVARVFDERKSFTSTSRFFDERVLTIKPLTST